MFALFHSLIRHYLLNVRGRNSGGKRGGGRWLLLPSLHWVLIPVILRKLVRKLPHLFNFFRLKTDLLWPMAVYSTVETKIYNLLQSSCTSTCMCDTVTLLIVSPGGWVRFGRECFTFCFQQFWDKRCRQLFVIENQMHTTVQTLQCSDNHSHITI